MEPTQPLLEAEHLGRRHPDGSRWLLDDVSLTIRPADRLGLVGLSGAGKTLLLRALALLDPLDRGEIRWRGRRIQGDRVPGFRAQAIYLHQRPALAGETVEATLREPFSLATHRRQHYQRDPMIARLGTLGRDASFLEKRVGDLSGGEAQVTALLRALQLDPLLLLLDEPTAALDPEATRAVEILVDGWLSESDGSRAVVWVSHDQSQLPRVAQRIITITAGRLLDHRS
jgi:putative ABC transport system ATP-binding protein